MARRKGAAHEDVKRWYHMELMVFVRQAHLSAICSVNSSFIICRIVIRWFG